MSKRRYMVALGIVVAAAAILLFLFRVSVDQAVVMRMVSFEESEPNSQVVWKDQESVRTFEYAIRFGKKMAGKVDIAAPPYSVTLGKKTYYLWISDQTERGSFMKAEDITAGKLYTMKKSYTKKLQALLKQAYPEGYSKPTGEIPEERNIDLPALEGGLEPNPPSESPTPAAEGLPSPYTESPAPVPDLPSTSPNAEAESFAPAYLDASSFTEEERPLIKLINLRITYMHESKWDEFLDLYTDSARKAREGSGSFNGFTITSINVVENISIREQKSLFEAVVQVEETRNNGDAGSTMYVFQKGKEKGAAWRIADVD
ncbi:hypothetical protein [Paenibacillus sp. FJAT-27812]|uniref:hypothetical protein n=1 Tax=Paenibacillus sp. FJAT-27812 TaxID=1684143 RepID=UPI0006A7B062|nr:hypothetical protein [Paenibacillus sp. FJAT-27812]